MQVLLHRSADKYHEHLNQSELKPLLASFADDYWKPVIEPASPEEAAMIDKRVKEYEKDPSSFVPRRKKAAIETNPIAEEKAVIKAG